MGTCIHQTTTQTEKLDTQRKTQQRDTCMIHTSSNRTLFLWQILSKNELRKATNNMNLQMLFTNTKAIKALIHYMENTGIFTKDRKPVMLWPEPRPPLEPPPNCPPRAIALSLIIVSTLCH